MSFAFKLIVLLTSAYQVWSLNVSNPVREIISAVGSSIDLHCECETTVGSEWRFNGSLRSTGRVLHIHNASLDDGGVYTCRGPDGDAAQNIHLRLGHAPSPPEVHCWSPNYPLKALCTWTLKPDPLLQTRYISTYWYGGDVHSCPGEDGRDGQGGRYGRCELEELEIYSNKPYLVNITAVNALGSASRVVSFIVEDIVKPDPPVNVTVKPLPGKKVLVRWCPPPTWPDPMNFPLKYSVEFQWGRPPLTSTMRSMETENVVRSAILPGRTYRVRVSCMDVLDHGQSSDWSHHVHFTLHKNQ